MAKLIGQSPNQVPTNADLGTMAYQDKDNLQVGDVEATGLNVIQGADTTTTVVIGGGDQARLVINGDRDNDGDSGTEDAVLVFDLDGAYNPAANSGLGKYGFRIGARNRAGATDLKFTEVIADTDYEYMRIVTGGEVQVTSGLLELDGNDIGGTQVTIADDAVASITPPRKGGFMFITLNGTADYPQHTHSGFIYYDVGASLLCLKQATTGVGTNVGAVNTDVSGTTGTDGVTTVAVQSGVIKIENRSGASGTYQVTFL